MKKLVYSPDAIEDIRQLKRRMTLQFGREVAEKNILKVRNAIKHLKEYPEIGVPAKYRWDIDSEFYVIYAHHDYVFYKTDETTVYIINILDEREDIMWKMFRVKNASDDSGFWDD